MRLSNLLKFRGNAREDSRRIEMPTRRDFIRKSVAAMVAVAVLGEDGEAIADSKTQAQLQYNRHLKIVIEDALVELRVLKSDEEYDLELVMELIEKSNLVKKRLDAYYTKGFYVYGSDFYRVDNSGMIKDLDSVYFDYKDFNGELAKFIIDEFDLKVKPMSGITPNDLDLLDDGTIILSYPNRIQGVETIIHEITIHPDGTVTEEYRVTFG